MARVGGARMPKGFAQFEARAYHQGTDGRTGTGDDVDLGVVDATWSLRNTRSPSTTTTSSSSAELMHVADSSRPRRTAPIQNGVEIETTSATYGS